MSQTIEELAKVVGLPQVDTKKVVEYLKHDILVSLYRKNPHEPAAYAENNIRINQKVAELYQQWYGHKFDPKVYKKSRPTPLFLHGIPGQGKTASYICAAAEVCAGMDLNLVEHVDDNYEANLNDFIIVSQECAGENSALAFGGLPKIEDVTFKDGTSESVLKSSVSYRFKVFKHCAGGVLLFDDAANAPTFIQNILLPVAQFGTFRGLKVDNACIGFTGNLGSLDGTSTSELTTALLTRVFSLFVVDSPENFLERSYQKYNDSLGTVGIDNFIARNIRDFARLPEPGSKSGFACSRAYDNAIDQCRSILQRNGGRGVGEDKSLPDFLSIAISNLGAEVGVKLVSYMNSFINGADPLAKKYILLNTPDKTKFEEKYAGGSAPESLTFGFQFATACGDYATNMIAASDNPKEAIKEAIKRFGNAVLMLNASEFSYSLEHLKTRMATTITDFSVQSGNGRELTPEIRELIAHTINDLDDCGASNRNILIKTISDFDKIDSTVSFQSQKKRTIPGK